MRRFGRSFKKRRGRNQGNGEVEVQITSLADILIVVLVFLLKSVSTELEDIESISIPNGVSLPKVASGGSSQDGIRIEITESSVSIGGKVASRLRGYRFPVDDLNKDLVNGGTSKSLRDVFKSLPSPASHGNKTVWVISDRRAPYSTIQTVLASSAIYGYSDFKLAVDTQGSSTGGLGE